MASCFYKQNETEFSKNSKKEIKMDGKDTRRITSVIFQRMNSFCSVPVRGRWAKGNAAQLAPLCRDPIGA